MISNLPHLVFITIVIVTFLHHAFAPWTTPPIVPPDSRFEDCQGWLKYHFFEDDPLINRKKSETRDRRYDPDVSESAAIYASILTLFVQYKPPKPFDMCFKLQKFSGVKFQYTALKDVHYTCMLWIKRYGYFTSSANDLWNIISERSVSEDRYISLWPALYAQYINKDKERATLKDCKGWLQFAGYTNDPKHNVQKAKSQDEDYEEIMNIFIRLYSQNLRKKDKFETPEEFCETLGDLAKEMRPYK